MDPTGLDACGFVWEASGVAVCSFICPAAVGKRVDVNLFVCGDLCSAAFLLSGEYLCSPPDPQPPPDPGGGICPEECDPESTTCY